MMSISFSVTQLLAVSLNGDRLKHSAMHYGVNQDDLHIHAQLARVKSLYVDYLSGTLPLHKLRGFVCEVGKDLDTYLVKYEE